MIDLGIIDCENIKSTDELIDFLTKKIINIKILKDAIVKIFFENINNHLLLEFEDKKIITFFSDTFYFEYKKTKLIDKINYFQEKIDISKQNFVENVFKDFLKDFEIPENINRKELEKELILKITT